MRAPPTVLKTARPTEDDTLPRRSANHLAAAQHDAGVADPAGGPHLIQIFEDRDRQIAADAGTVLEDRGGEAAGRRLGGEVARSWRGARGSRAENTGCRRPWRRGPSGRLAAGVIRVIFALTQGSLQPTGWPRARPVREPECCTIITSSSCIYVQSRGRQGRVPQIGVEAPAIDPAGIARHDIKQGRHHRPNGREKGSARLEAWTPAAARRSL